MLYFRKKSVMLHPYLPITANSLQRPLSSVPKVAVVERFNCSNWKVIGSTPVWRTRIFFFRVCLSACLTEKCIYQDSFSKTFHKLNFHLKHPDTSNCIRMKFFKTIWEHRKTENQVPLVCFYKHGNHFTVNSFF